MSEIFGHNIQEHLSEYGTAEPHVYPPEWQDGDWLVPFRQEHAIIYHGHAGHDEEDCHVLCGPLVFCCQRSKQLYLERCPQRDLAQADWSAVPATQIVSWMDAGVQIIYLIYCSTELPDGLTAYGLSGKQARDVLLNPMETDKLPKDSIHLFEQIIGAEPGFYTAGDASPTALLIP